MTPEQINVTSDGIKQILIKIRRRADEIRTILSYVTARAATQELRDTPRTFNEHVSERLTTIRKALNAGRIAEARARTIILSKQVLKARARTTEWLSEQQLNPRVEAFIRGRAKITRN